MELPEFIVNMIHDYLATESIPRDRFPGYKPMAMVNQVAAIGEAVVRTYKKENTIMGQSDDKAVATAPAPVKALKHNDNAAWMLIEKSSMGHTHVFKNIVSGIEVPADVTFEALPEGVAFSE